MAPTDAQKRAAAKWDGENMATIGCKLKKAQADAFKVYCAERGKTSNAVLREYVLHCISEDNDLKAASRIAKEFGVSIEEVEYAERFSSVIDRIAKQHGVSPMDVLSRLESLTPGGEIEGGH